MAENKKSFVIYCDVIDNIDHLTYTEKGKLFQHLLEYVNDMNPKLTNRVLLSSWKPIERQLKRDLKKYEQKRKQWSEAGKRSAEVRKLKRNSTDVNERSKRSTDLTVNDNVNVNVTTTVEVDFLKIDGWIKEISKEQVYQEGIYRTFKIKKGSISKLLLTFKHHLKMFPKQHRNFSEFKKHFNNWLHTKNNKNELNEYKSRSKGDL